MVGGTDPTPRRSFTSVDVGGRADQERCISIPRWAGIIPEVAGTQRMDIPMAIGVQQMRDRPVVACTRYSGDDIGIKAIHPSQHKMTKKY